MDQKQTQLIQSWIARSEQSGDSYFQFISLWIAFNALCYSLHSAKANGPRADDLRGFNFTKESLEVDAHVTIINSKVAVRGVGLDFSLTVTEKYTEDKIFASYATETKSLYKAEFNKKERLFRAVGEFQQALAKDNGFYVLNLTKQNCGQVLNWSQDQIERGSKFHSSLHSPENLHLLKDVLYQVRCNIFHGEKVPGDPNDDRIVKVATPVLQELIKLARRRT